MGHQRTKMNRVHMLKKFFLGNDGSIYEVKNPCFPVEHLPFKEDSLREGDWFAMYSLVLMGHRVECVVHAHV